MSIVSAYGNDEGSARHSECLKLLYFSGADVNAVDDFGGSPLHHAAYCHANRLPMVKLLILLGANVNARNA